MANHVRLTISIPAYVRERMRKYERETNWSAVASAEFAAECDRLEDAKRKELERRHETEREALYARGSAGIGTYSRRE